MGDIRGEEASVIMKRWIEVLEGMTESCVEIDEHQPPLFDILYVSSLLPPEAHDLITNEICLIVCSIHTV